MQLPSLYLKDSKGLHAWICRQKFTHWGHPRDSVGQFIGDVNVELHELDWIDLNQRKTSHVLLFVQKIEADHDHGNDMIIYSIYTFEPFWFFLQYVSSWIFSRTGWGFHFHGGRRTRPPRAPDKYSNLSKYLVASRWRSSYEWIVDMEISLIL